MEGLCLGVAVDHHIIRVALDDEDGALRTPDDLALAVEELHELASGEGRGGRHLDVSRRRESSSIIATPDRTLERVEALTDAGVTWMVVDPPGDDLERTVELIASTASPLSPTRNHCGGRTPASGAEIRRAAAHPVLPHHGFFAITRRDARPKSLR